MMLIDGASRLSLTRKRGQFGNSNTNSNSSSSPSSSRRLLLKQKQKQKNKKPTKKSVRFDMTRRSSVRSFPKASKEEAEHIWHSNYDYPFFVLNWKYYPHEPMEPRSFLDTLWQINNTPETMRMEDYQCFQPQEQPKRQQIRDTVLNAYENASSFRSDAVAPLAASMTAEHRRQAQVCGALNEKEVQDYLHSSSSSSSSQGDEIMDSSSSSSKKSQHQQQADAMTYLSEYVDSIIHRTAALWPTQ
mmetsp:Transcript_16666/g.40621  ORF Transcript_16666/g.40621 Transcript_16666/m.40621 type:complete len:245 (-) Transcript_16666:264-998(-)|eukprot:CAMPEP_0113647168 /NCGR_PEP_ID=MMETSP0017_2-20120614/24958_1 /TAXON_ID=2856 /ORGANISM="Cylindrotheca closterium" /LENGTH=244 /DNA_ID=CAMNT_0000559189 /DNA_START=39 /DNA_END=773 /DNA_ORIENTATION=- /assembly_acc=CAM_ASM_000147